MEGNLQFDLTWDQGLVCSFNGATLGVYINISTDVLIVKSEENLKPYSLKFALLLLSAALIFTCVYVYVCVCVCLFLYLLRLVINALL